MCRGYITRGNIHHTEDQIIGTGYQRAYEMESQVSVFKVQADERGTPFVEVDNSVVQLIEQSDDKCVKEMFSRTVKSDGDATAIYPFHVLGHSFLVDDRFSAEEELAQVQHIRDSIQWFKENILKSVDASNESANRKAQHYIRALDGQLENCTKVEKTIKMLTMTLGELNPDLFK